MPKNSKDWIVFLLLMLFTGYALGTALLLGPLRLIVDFAREKELSTIVESLLVILSILILIAVSAALSLWGLNKVKSTNSLWRKALIFLVPIIASSVALSCLLNPAFINKSAEKESVSERFTIGPYPEEAQIKQLKDDGYTGIISLLHPAVAPFEPKLLADEEKNAQKAGIELIKAPMLPWLTDNESSVAKIKALVKTGKGKYYVHCYLGKDRVNVVKNLISRLNDTVTIKSSVAHRNLEEIGAFERGDIYKVADSIYIPYPTKEEFLGYILAGNYKTVVSLLNPVDKENTKLIADEKKLLGQYELPFLSIPVKDGISKAKLKLIVEQLLELPRPLVIHHWNTSSELSVLILEAFKAENQEVIRLKDL